VQQRNFNMSVQRVLVIGDFDHPSFQSAMDWMTKCAEVTAVKDIDEALGCVAGLETMNVGVFVQARPGRITQSHVERIHALAPLARLAVLAGEWCEGELRTGDAIIGVMRFYWHEWPVRLKPLILTAASSDSSLWALPRTTLPGEKTLSFPPHPTGAPGRLIAICTHNASSFDTLAAACRSGGWGAAWLDIVRPYLVRSASAVIWEGELDLVGHFESLARIARMMQPAPTIAVVGFARYAETNAAYQAGAVGLIAKPFFVADLMSTIRSVTQTLPNAPRL
jgi:CheY-like chemotaxis protein